MERKGTTEQAEWICADATRSGLSQRRPPFRRPRQKACSLIGAAAMTHDHSLCPLVPSCPFMVHLGNKQCDATTHQELKEFNFKYGF